VGTLKDPRFPSVSECGKIQTPENGETSGKERETEEAIVIAAILILRY